MEDEVSYQDEDTSQKNPEIPTHVRQARERVEAALKQYMESGPEAPMSIAFVEDVKNDIQFFLPQEAAFLLTAMAHSVTANTRAGMDLYDTIENLKSKIPCPDDK